MEQSTCNKLRNVVTQCRKLLEESIAQQLQGKFGIYAGKKDTVQIDDEDRLSFSTDEDKQYRLDLLDHFEHIKARSFNPKEAFDQLIREIAFTHLNRLCAYKMMEARGVYVGGQKFRESVGRGINSNGFKFYLADHPDDERLFNTGEQELAYRHFLDWLGGLLSEEIGVLFNPNDPANRLYPRQNTLDKLLELLNDEELAGIWEQDETIGWVYQYFTPKELRDQARKESPAPRNSYELAFRNQFFTPRYIVEFLTDNTLGRIWYEMRRGDTALKDQCVYMVRRPSEVFLGEGQGPQVSEINGEELSKEELLKQPVQIAHRPKKDPRDLRVLDPACGSGHFLLYCFDVLLTIYAEAYDDPDLGPKLKAEYSDKSEFTEAVPGLILANNLHGIDIDLRATQIAALALWLRCQRVFQKMGLNTRPKITRSNIVCAEPMPGEQEMLKEFTGDLKPRVLGQLVEVVFDKMKLAGEAGSLLKIEEELRDAIAEAKKQWQAAPKEVQLSLFESRKHPKKSEQQSLFDTSGISDTEFWDEAESNVLSSLHDYAAKALNGKTLQRQLFADDAARGFAFIDLCQKRFDVVLMNPPFGSSTTTTDTWIKRCYPRTKNDIYAAFVERGIALLANEGMLGAITSRTGFFLSSFQKWREEILLEEVRPAVFADLGFGVLDAAKVETAVFCLTTDSRLQTSTFIRLLDETDKPESIAEAVRRQSTGESCSFSYSVDPDSFRQIPGSPFAYWVSERVRKLFTKHPIFESHGRALRQGLATSDDFRFVRTWWEVSPMQVLTGFSGTLPDDFRQQTTKGRRWAPVVKAGVNAPFYTDLPMVALWEDDGREMKAFAASKYRQSSRTIKNTGYYFKAGITWSSRPWLRGFFSLVPPGSLFTHTGMMLFLPDKDLMATCSLLNSDAYAGLLHLLMARGMGAETDQTLKYEVGYLSSVPIPLITEHAQHQLDAIACRCYEMVRSADTTDELTHSFFVPIPVQSKSDSLSTSADSWHRRMSNNSLEIAGCRQQINEVAYSLYEISDEDRKIIESSLERTAMDEASADRSGDSGTSRVDVANDLMSYGVGCALGRWDIRIATESAVPTPLPSVNDPLPVRSPGMRDEANGVSGSYPLRIDLDGILVDDPEHKDDIVGNIRHVFESIWDDRSEAIEQEAVEILGSNRIRDYFRKPGKGGFWDGHVKRYSKSRRKAPIYWLLQSSKKNYGLWLYYHRLDKDMLFKALLNYVEPKIQREENRLAELRSQKSSDDSGKAAKKTDREIEKQEDLLSELRDFEEKLRKAAELHLVPDLNDGVVLNIAPLHELVPWKEAKKYWNQLMDGKYEWSSIGKQLREKGLVK